VADKGAARGALIVLERTLADTTDGTLLATQTMTLMARGDGGFSQEPGNGPPGGDPVTAARPAPPDGPPDAVLDLPTLPQSALIYRLVADPNPLHADPVFARAAGFERPILHGLCTYGFASRALLASLCGGDASRFRAMDARFAKPAYPGDTLVTEIWADGESALFETKNGQGESLIERGAFAFTKAQG
jgi:acyl dehydratase